MAWYHVGGCSCPVGCCDCGDRSQVKVKASDIKSKKVVSTSCGWCGERWRYCNCPQPIEGSNGECV